MEANREMHNDVKNGLKGKPVIINLIETFNQFIYISRIVLLLLIGIFVIAHAMRKCILKRVVLNATAQ